MRNTFENTILKNKKKNTHVCNNAVAQDISDMYFEIKKLIRNSDENIHIAISDAEQHGCEDAAKEVFAETFAKPILKILGEYAD